MRLSECFLDKSVVIKEGPATWPFSIRHTCSTQGVSSGSPIIVNDTNNVIALTNTATDTSMGSPCDFGPPCEIMLGRKAVLKEGFNYAQSLMPLKGCFDRNGIFNLDLNDCMLKQ